MGVGEGCENRWGVVYPFLFLFFPFYSISTSAEPKARYTASLSSSVMGRKERRGLSSLILPPKRYARNHLSHWQFAPALQNDCRMRWSSYPRGCKNPHIPLMFFLKKKQQQMGEFRTQHLPHPSPQTQESQYPQQLKTSPRPNQSINHPNKPHSRSKFSSSNNKLTPLPTYLFLLKDYKRKR